MIVTLLGALYIVIATFVAGVFIGEEMGFKNPKYHWALAIGITWPLVLVVVILQNITGMYIGDVYKNLKG